MKDGKIYPIIFIAVLSLLCAGLLTATNEALQDKIKANNEANMRAAVVCALGLYDDKDKINALDWEKTKEVAKIFEKQVEVKGTEKFPLFVGKKEGKIVGTAALFDANGKVGPIKGAVALNSDKTKLLGVRVYDQKETPAYGGKAFNAKDQWCKNFTGLAVQKGAKMGRFIKTKGSNLTTGVDTISGATITMDALDRGIIEATKYIVTGVPPIKTINITTLDKETARKVAAVCALGLAKDPENKGEIAECVKIYDAQIKQEKKGKLTLFICNSTDGKFIGRGVEFSAAGIYGKPFKGIIAFDAAKPVVLGMRLFELNESNGYGQKAAEPGIGWIYKFKGLSYVRKGNKAKKLVSKKKEKGFVQDISGASTTTGKIGKALYKTTKDYLKLFPVKKSDKTVGNDNKEVVKPTTPAKSDKTNTTGKRGNVKIDTKFDYAKEIKDWSKATKAYPGKRPKNKLPIQPKKYSPPAITSPAGVTNVALGKKVTTNASKDMEEFFGTEDKDIFKQLTDGKFACKDDKAGLTLENWYVEDEGTQPYFQVDLEKEYELYGIGVWHFYYRPRWFKDVIVLASNDPKFEKNVHVLWSNDDDNTVGYGKGKDPYFPTAWYGHVIDVTKTLNAQIKNKTGFATAKGKSLVAPSSNQLVARYIRIYTGAGFTEAPTNLVEIAAWGRPVGAKSPATSTPATKTKTEPKKTPVKKTKVEAKKEQPKTQPKVSGNVVKYTMKCPKKIPGKTPKPVNWKKIEKKAVSKPGVLMMPKGCTNVALKKPVTSSLEDEPFMGELNYLTDGLKLGDEDTLLCLDVGEQWVQIDLGQPCTIYGIALWHFNTQKRAYKGVVIQLADDAKFTKNVRTIFNNDCENVHGLGKGADLRYFDTRFGKVFPVKGETARYVRFYSAGNSSNDDNHYVEAEVFGVPAKGAATTPKAEVKKDAAKPAGDLVKFQPTCPAKLAVKTPKPVKWKQVEKRPAAKPGTLMLPKGCKNIALNKTVTSSIPEDEDPLIGEISYLTDGDKKGDDDSVVALDVDSQWVQIDLGKECTIYGIALWHYHQQTRIYKGVVIQIADDAAFTKNVRTIFNNDCDNLNKLGKGTDLRYYDTRFGKAFPVKGEKARYVRFYSAGNSSNDDNHYVEAEVYGFESK